VAWKGASNLDASALLSAPTDPEERSVLQEAKDLLWDALADGPVPAAEVKREARSADISERTLKTAKRELGVLASRESEPGKRGGGRWVWELRNPSTSIKGASPEGLPSKSDSARAGADNVAYLERFANRVASCEDSAHGHLLERSQDEGSRSGRAGHPQKRRGRDLLRLAEDAQTLA
jgi:hypothetical protein